MTKIRIIIKVSRYQHNKEVGILYREIGIEGESFTEFKKRFKKEQKKLIATGIS